MSTIGSGSCATTSRLGITLYTIQVNTGGDPTSTILQSCASDSSNFFLLTSADQIVTAFDQIGTSLLRCCGSRSNQNEPPSLANRFRIRRGRLNPGLGKAGGDVCDRLRKRQTSC